MNHYNIYSIFILSMLLMLILTIEIIRKRRIDFLLIFNFSYALFFALIPIIITFFPDLLYYGIPANWAYHFDVYKDNLVVASIYAFLFYSFFIIIYSLINKKRFIAKSTEIKLTLINQNVLFLFGIAFLIFGILSFFLYSTTMGGPIGAIVNAQLKRSGVYEATGVYTFFKHFMKSVYFGLFVFLTTSPSKKIFISLRKLLLIISIFFSIIVLLSYSGRANIVILLLTILFYKNVLNNKIFMSKSQLFQYIGFIAIFGIISAFYRPFMLMLSGREIIFENGNVLVYTWTSIIKAFSVPMISLMVAIEKFSFVNISLGSGALQIFLDIIPKSIINPERIYLINNLNTELFGYFNIRNYNINAGLLAYFYYEFHWLGIFIGSSITAVIIKLFDDLLRSLKFNPTYGMIMVYFLLNLPHRIMAGDQVGGFKSFLILIVEFMVLFFLAKSVNITTSKFITDKGYKIAAKVKQ